MGRRTGLIEFFWERGFRARESWVAGVFSFFGGMGEGIGVVE